MQRLNRLVGMTLHEFIIKPNLNTTLKFIDHRIDSDYSERFAELDLIRPLYQEMILSELPLDVVDCSLSHKDDNKQELAIELEKNGKIIVHCEKSELVFKNFS